VGIAGHGFGGSAAIFAAAGMTNRVKSVAAIFPAVTKPPAEQPAATLKVPGVVFSAPGDPATLRSNALNLSRAWDGGVLRLVSKGEADGFAEGRKLAKFAGLPGSDRRTQKTVRALLTGYLLYTLTGDKTYREFADPEAVLPRTDAIGPELTTVTPEEKVIALLRT
jgi:hypothetical protein